MSVAMNGINLEADQNKTSYIAGLCDVVPNKKRDDYDFQSLLKCLEQMPKECTPFKGKILLHLRIHALENPNVNLRLLASCFAKATLLYRKTPNKSEGPVGCWKSGLLGELITLEDNLNQLYSIAGLTTNNVLSRISTEDGDDEYLKPYERLNDSNQDFENIINEHLLKINLAAHNICALISVQTEFEIPIPLFILLKISAKVGQIRWKDYKKKPNGLLKNYVCSLAPYLIEINLMMFKSIITVLGSNIIPFIAFINQTSLRILDWSRSSNLSKHDENVYHTVRSHVFETMSFIAEQLSLNLNLDPQLLKVLLTSELVDNLEELLARPSECTLPRDKHVIEALKCLENLLIIYADLLDATLECKLKSHVIQTCLGIYRDFNSNTINETCRKQLLRLLQTIANQPYATSTTEISYHIFELAEKFESDPEIRSLIRRSLKIGLAHRPTIVTHYDVYNCYGRPMLSAGDLSSSLASQQVPSQPLQVDTTPLDPRLPLQRPSPDAPQPASPEPAQPASLESESTRPASPEPIHPTSPESELASEPAVEQVKEVAAPVNGCKDRDAAGSPDSDIMIIEQNKAPGTGEPVGLAAQDEEQDAGKEDSEIVSYMSFFVEKLA